MIFPTRELTFGTDDYTEYVRAEGGLLAHYRKCALLFRAQYRSVCDSYPGMPWPLPRSLLALLLIPNFAQPALKDLKPPEATEVPEMVSWFINWRDLGAPTYQLSHSLASALLLTDPGAVPYEDIPWPYPAFMVTLPSPDSPLVFTDGAGRDEVGRFIVVYRYQTPAESRLEEFHLLFDAVYQDAGARLSARVRGRHSAPECADALFREALPVNFKHLDLSLPAFESPGDHALIRVVGDHGGSIYARAPWPLTRPASQASVEPWITRRHLDNITELSEKDNRALIAAHRLVVNLLLYLGSLRDHNRPVTSKKRGANSATNDPGYELFDVPLIDPEKGTVIKLAPELRQAARDWCRHGEDPKRGAASAPAYVSGHWRRVPYGPRKSEDPTYVQPRRRLWIAPFRRGPKDLDPIAKTYVVEKGKTP